MVALGALTWAVLTVGRDGTVLSVALPDLATDLHASTADLQWLVFAYTLVLAAALLLGDRYGRKRVLLGALVLLGTGSLACAYASSVGAFIAARVLLGLGAAAIIPPALSVLTVLFTDEERPGRSGSGRLSCRPTRRGHRCVVGSIAAGRGRQQGWIARHSWSGTRGCRRWRSWPRMMPLSRPSSKDRPKLGTTL